MKCEECLPRLEEYIDGELDGRGAERIESHLSICPKCASEYAELKREEEIYAHYHRDLEVTPAQWAMVRARIEQERDAGIERVGTPLSMRLREMLHSRRRFRPAAAYALLLIVAGITASLIYLNQRHRQAEPISVASKQVEAPATAGIADAPPPGESHNGVETTAGDVNGQKIDSNRLTPMTHSVARSNSKQTNTRPKTVDVANLTPSQKPGAAKAAKPTPDGNARFEMAMANLADGTERSASTAAGDFDFEVARHAGRAELLLRSFRNVRLPAQARSLDVSYEKESARKLLYRNIALRRDAAARGDQPTMELLNGLEPILLDIANLPGRAKSRDVRPIEQQMKKKEIIATLQVRTLLASN
jgi:anti-sigma factor RsiW